MFVWFSPNHGTEFSNIGTVFRTIQDWILKVDIRAGFGSRTIGKCMLDFVVNCFPRQFSGRVLRMFHG